ncbi:MAG: hypothetical protein HY774_26060 [Acidobacteria bacterium]|nr:hypothetical protein [Acidobacteriota bacterium]
MFSHLRLKIRKLAVFIQHPSGRDWGETPFRRVRLKAALPAGYFPVSIRANAWSSKPWATHHGYYTTTLRA